MTLICFIFAIIMLVEGIVVAHSNVDVPVKILNIIGIISLIMSIILYIKGMC